MSFEKKETFRLPKPPIFRAPVSGNKVLEESALENIGLVYNYIGEFENAIDSYEGSLCILKSSFGSDHSKIKTVEELLRIAKEKLNDQDFKITSSN